MANTDTTISRMPPEIMREIFLHCPHSKSTLSPTDTPWTLTRVNRSWRIIASKTSELWRKVHIDNAKATMSNITSLIPLAMERTNEQPIDVTFDFKPISDLAQRRDPLFRSRTRRGEWKKEEDIMEHAFRTLLISTKSRQWRSLVTSPLHPTLVRIMSDVLEDIRASFFENLRKIEVLEVPSGFNSAPELVHFITESLGHLPSLRQLRVLEAVPSLPDDTLAQLQTFGVAGAINASDLKYILEKATSLTNLHISDITCSSNATTVAQTMIELPPALDVLSLDSWQVPSSFNTQSLRVLIIHHLDYEAAGFIASVEAVDLTSLSNLTLKSFPPMDRTILRILRKTPNIEELVLSGHVGNHLLKSLVASESSTQDAFLPRLHAISITSYPTFKISLFHDVIHSRSLEYGLCTCSIWQTINNSDSGRTEAIVLSNHKLLGDPEFILRELFYAWECQVASLGMVFDPVVMGVKKDNENLEQLDEIVGFIEEIGAKNVELYCKVYHTTWSFPALISIEKLYSEETDGRFLIIRIHSIAAFGRSWKELDDMERDTLAGMFSNWA